MDLIGDLDQMQTPLFSALKNYADTDVIPFYVPGHKGGVGIDTELIEYLGKRVFEIDVNGMDDLDNICNPTGVIDRSQKLMANLFGADYAFFLLNGTTQGIQSMILHSCRPGDKIIIPRNVHRSAISALILSGAVPVYIQPEIDDKLGIAMGVTVESVTRAISTHADAKAILIIHPTYYGAISDLASIADIAHESDMLVLADEAHGSHLQFDCRLPKSAMASGADMSAISLHKTGGSMTQTSALLMNGRYVDRYELKTTLNLLQTTSGSYVLMASLDLARRQLATRGREMIRNVLELSNYARRRINEIDGLYAFGSELVGNPGVWKFDETKLGINVTGMGLTGYEVERLLRKNYNIQVEMADFGNILAIISLGDTIQDVDKLIYALEDMASMGGGRCNVYGYMRMNIPPPITKYCCSPRDAYYSPKTTMKLDSAIGKISGEMLMAYPPGIPIICPGEEITWDIVEYIKLLKASKYQLQGTKDATLEYIEVIGG